MPGNKNNPTVLIRYAMPQKMPEKKHNFKFIVFGYNKMKIGTRIKNAPTISVDAKYEYFNKEINRRKVDKRAIRSSNIL